jgi:hypothetical protein
MYALVTPDLMSFPSPDKEMRHLSRCFRRDRSPCGQLREPGGMPVLSWTDDRRS